MKPSYEWDETDLQSLITDQVQESLTLDYKACGALDKTDGKKNEISKDVSAFANSAGGTLVYGMIEQGHLPTAIDAGYDPSVISKEWLEQIINSRIQQRIDGIIVNPVALSGVSAGQYAYIVYVPQSLRAPHMASDHRYYKRFNFESVMMEDYEVRDVRRRGDSPLLRLVVSFIDGYVTGLQFTEGSSHSVDVPLIVHIENDANAVAEVAAFALYIDSYLIVSRTGGLTSTGLKSLVIGGDRSLVQHLYMSWTRNRLPLWTGIKISLSDSQLAVAFPREPGTYNLMWDARTPNAEARFGIVRFVSDGTTVTLYDEPYVP